jgi:hypothetical protein
MHACMHAHDLVQLRVLHLIRAQEKEALLKLCKKNPCWMCAAHELCHGKAERPSRLLLLPSASTANSRGADHATTCSYDPACAF